MPKPDKHAIRMPGVVLDQIRSKQESGDYSKDRRFAHKRKFEEKRLSRKDKRKEERRAKKQKKQPHPEFKQQGCHSDSRSELNNDKNSSVKPVQNESKHARNDSAEDPLAALKALKQKKAEAAQSQGSGFRVVREDDLNDELSDLGGSGSELDGGESQEEFSGEDLGDMDSEFEDFDGLESEEDPLAALKKLKEKKHESDDEMLPEIDSDFEGSENEFGDASKPEGSESYSDGDAEDFGFDDDELNSDDFGESDEELEATEDPLAQLKALKEAKSKKESKKNDETEVKNKKDKKDKKDDKKKDRHLEANFVDPLDNDLEYYAKKLGLKDGKKSKLSKTDQDDVVGGLLDGLDFDSESEPSASESDTDESSDEERGPKENPFVAPGTETEAAPTESSGTSKYVPPALRRKMALENSEDNSALQRSIKGPINKLSENNVGSIVNEINGLYLNNARQAVNETLTTVVLDSIVQQGRLLDTFVYLHAALVVAIYRLQGVDFGAFFIQTLIEKFEAARKAEDKSKEALNLVSLLSSVYALQLVSSKLLYDLIKDLIDELSESNAEILLKIIRNCGNQMRSDDPGSLKEIVLQVTKKSASLSNSPRMQFLIETIQSLKNNKMTSANADSHELMVRLKKFLGSFVSAKLADPLQVSLDDIRSVDTRGKWWLVGSAWKGNEAQPEVLANVAAMNDILESAEPNWVELAKLQRMNTDIRRAIFISIMSANDYVEAVTKLDKLALKKSQEREIPRIVVHCAVVEPAYNPYYGILAAKLCDSHSYRKTFQFILWDLVKSFDGGADDDSDDDFAGFDENPDDDDKLKKILNLGRLFGNLFAEGSLPLHILRTVNFVTASADLKMFMEVLFVTYFDNVGKKSQVNAIGTGLVGKKSMSEQKFDDRILIERVLKAKDEPSMLRGICHFIKKVAHSDFITGRKQRKRVEWGVRSMCDVTEEIVKETEEF